MELIDTTCPYCRSSELKQHSTYNTQNYGRRPIMQCQSCMKFFSPTKNTFMAGIRKPISFIVDVFNARTEGVGLNATCRIFNVAKNTVLDWERRLSSIKQVLFLYAMAHQFFQIVIEGDELYTKVGKNTPPDKSRGWTVVLMDRASRFLWELQCGKKDRKLFRKAIRTLGKLVDRTKDISLITDGEPRYGNILFEICYEILQTGKRGRPRKTLKKGVKVRMKNKGSQSHKRGRKRPKYKAPCPEHPQTIQNIENKDIHANHCEAFNSSIRRRNAAYRRKTNTYAKNEESLQRTLDVYWVIHNFIRTHFTTKKVPAVAMGIIKEKLSWENIFMIRVAATV